MEPDFDEWVIKERLRWSLSGRFLVRFHAALILLGAIVVGWAANRLLYSSGVGNMLVRLPIGVLAAYGGFLLGIDLWIRYSGIEEYLNSKRSKELLDPKEIKPPPFKEAWPLPAASMDGEGCLFVVLLLVAIAIVLAMGGYLIVMSADLFAEIVFELLLAAGLIRGIRRADLSGPIGIPKITLPALAVALAVSIAFGLWARLAHPEAKTLAQAVAAEAADYRAARDAARLRKR